MPSGNACASAGAKLVTKDGERSTAEVLEGKKLVALYFSAHWCGPCRKFTPLLSVCYEVRLLLPAALDAIRARRAGARERGLVLVGVVGSVARREAGPESDVDVVYEVAGRPTLFDVGEISMDLQDDLGRPIDMIDLKTVKPRLRAAMERDLVRA